MKSPSRPATLEEAPAPEEQTPIWGSRLGWLVGTNKPTIFMTTGSRHA